jgi:hypothetical protein
MALLAKGDIDIGLTFISEIITEPGVTTSRRYQVVMLDFFGDSGRSKAG